MQTLIYLYKPEVRIQGSLWYQINFQDTTTKNQINKFFLFQKEQAGNVASSLKILKTVKIIITQRRLSGRAQ